MFQRRALKEDLRIIFNKFSACFLVLQPPNRDWGRQRERLQYATVQKGDEQYMTYEDFVCRFLQIADNNAPSETIKLLGDLTDTTKNGLISFNEFRSFESLLCSPDVITQLAFKLFDIENKGRITFKNFKKVLSATSIHKQVPFDFDSNFVKLYFGKEKDSQLNYHEFCQVLQSLPTEHARQAFTKCDSDEDGSISAIKYVDLMMNIRGSKMSNYVQEHLLSVAGGSSGRKVSYAYFKAFNQFLGNLDLMEKIVVSATDGDPHNRVTYVQLLNESQKYAQVTPLQVSFLYDLCSLEDRMTGTITLSEFKQLLPELKLSTRKSEPIETYTPVADPPDMHKISFLKRALEPVYRFSLGGIAGAVGATAVYPIDLVKTRLQNQRGSIAGEIMYKNSFDCFTKVIRAEGVRGLYRGLLPQLVGVSPEKAIKLTTNDTMRDFLRGKDGSLPVWKECIAGGTGGMCQVMFTNPLEIVKIRLQVAGEMGQIAKALDVVRHLGPKGLYLGAKACFLRDIPFSAIYFPTYAHLKTSFGGDKGQLNPGQLFLAGFIAGVPAAGLVTPADVIKTRLQVVARKGQQTYTGVIDCFRKVLAAEGPTAFWKGAPARVFRSSPQFGVTLLTYELLQRLFYIDFGHSSQHSKSKTSTQPSVPTKPLDSTLFYLSDHLGGYRMAYSAFAGIESRFGITFPNEKRD